MKNCWYNKISNTGCYRSRQVVFRMFPGDVWEVNVDFIGKPRIFMKFADYIGNLWISCETDVSLGLLTLTWLRSGTFVCFSMDLCLNKVNVFEKVHLDDLDVLDTLKVLWSSVVKLAKKFNSTSFNLKQEAFIRRDEDWPEEGWYTTETSLKRCKQEWTVYV